MREGRARAWLSGLRLDAKLGLRMLIKYPVVTTASVLAIAVAVALATAGFEFMSDLAFPRLPLDEPDRIVTLRNIDLETAEAERQSLHDFEAWRDDVESIRDLSAAVAAEYSVRTADDRFAMLEGMRVTPSLFRLARVQPLIGRVLTEADADPGAGPVAVIGYDAWQRLFDGDRSIIGETVRLGAESATVVGVMPEGFGFPVNEEIWTPLRERAIDYPRREGPAIGMVGRLAPGSSLEDARAELAAIGQRAARELPETHAQLRPQVQQFGAGDEALMAAALNIPFLLFLLVVSANIATLLLARTATRESELAMRSALGASRGRIVFQLVAESLVLTVVAAAIGLAGAAVGLRWGMRLFFEVQQTRPPFWFDFGLSAPTVLYVSGLALLGAVIIGGIPGLRVTRRSLRHRLGQPGSSGAGMKFGLVATGVIVVQVALCVAFIPVAIMNGQELLADQRPTDFAAESFLSGRVTAQGDLATPSAPGQPARQREEERRDLFDDVERRLSAEPGVLAVTRASRLPGFNHPVDRIEVEGDSTVAWARAVGVDPDFFDVVGAQVVHGRPFAPGDAEREVGAVILAQDWAEDLFSGRSALGRRIRFPGREGEAGTRWHEVVGLVRGVERSVGPGSPVAVFQPLEAGANASLQLYVRTQGAPRELVPQIHDLVTAVDPALAAADLMPLRDVWRPVERSNVFFVTAMVVVAGIILLFALIGIYALVSFTVAQRTREIGIRAALGADPRRIVVAIFSRALAQIGLGVVAGGLLVSLTLARSPEGFRLVLGVAAAMLVVGLLGCVSPARRALRIQPVEALRAE